MNKNQRGSATGSNNSSASSVQSTLERTAQYVKQGFREWFGEGNTNSNSNLKLFETAVVSQASEKAPQPLPQQSKRFDMASATVDSNLSNVPADGLLGSSSVGVADRPGNFPQQVVKLDHATGKLKSSAGADRP